MIFRWQNALHLWRHSAQNRLSHSPLARLTWFSLMARVFKEMGDDDATHLAAGVAYYAMFSLFPLLMGLLAISGSVLASEGLERRFVDFVTANLPGSRDLVSENVSQVIQFRGVLGIGAVLGLLWSASAVFGAITRAVNRALEQVITSR